MKTIKLAAVLFLTSVLCAAAPATSSLGKFDDMERTAGPLESSLILYGWPGGLYYSASFLGIPFEGVLHPGEPLIMDVPDVIHIEFELVDADEVRFTLNYFISFNGIVLFDGVSNYGHGLYVIYYNPSAPTPMIWDLDFNAFWYNGPGQAHLWAMYIKPPSWDLHYVTASAMSGEADVSFAFPNFIFVDALVSEFGETTNIYDYRIDLPWTTYQGLQPLPFGFFTVAYQAPSCATFRTAAQGCSMAHCDVWMSDNPNMSVPTGGDTRILWHDSIPEGSSKGLGCSSNGTLAVCTYQNPAGNNLVVYDARGSRLWTSGDHLGSWAWTSAAMIDESGGVIAVDDTHIIRFDSDGAVKWKTPTPGGIPISPVITDGGVVIVATQGGPLAAFDTMTGMLLGKLYLRETPESTEFYHTLNTPSVLGSRVYISTEKNGDPDRTGRLWAVDVDPMSPDGVLQAKWSFPFGGPSGASPLIVGDTLYFDGDRLNPGEEDNPHLFALQDLGETYCLKWTYAMDAPIRASVARDPRGGIWSFGVGKQWLYRLDQETGEMLDLLDIDELIDEPGVNFASSVMTIAGDASHPVMIVGSTTSTEGQPAWVIAVDLEPETLLWKVKLSDDWATESTNSQFSILADDEGGPVVVFPGTSSGAYGVGSP